MNRRASPALQRLLWRLCLAGSLAWLGGCGGSDDPVPGAPGAPPPVVVGNQAPVAAFAADAGVDAGTPLVLDASPSSDADGDALLYRWDFGDGTLGGGRRIAHVFVAGGRYGVRLTVDDGRGGSHSFERVVTVAAAPAPVAMVDTAVRTRALDGTPLSGVSVTWVGSTASTVTDAGGRATLRTGTGVAAMLKFSKPGFADQLRDAALPDGAESGFVEVAMMPRQPASSLADAAAGGTLTGQDGMSVVLAPNSLVDAAGSAVSGPVSVSMTPVDVAANVRGFPGRFAGLRSSGASGLLMSYGAVEFVLEAAGRPVQLAPGAKARIEIPVYTRLHRDGRAMQVGDVSPLWSLDERTGDWVEEGSGEVVAANTPSGFALRAEVQHFSWWNHDDFVNPPGRPKPKCVVDTNLDGVLEDLTGTGYCWHAGTGPEQEEREQPAAVRRLDVDPRTSRMPAFAVWAATPAAGGVVLPIAPDTDVTFRSYAKNGTLFGTRVVRLGPDVEQEVQILLSPVQSLDGPTAITLPYDNTVMMAQQAEVDRFTFQAEANASYEIVVSAALGSSFAGQVSVLGSNGAALGGGSFGSVPSSTTVLASAAGTMTIDLAATRNAPGAYRIQVRKLQAAGCATNPTLTLPGSTGSIAMAADSQSCFDLPLAADDVVQITATGSRSIANRLAVFSSSGAQLASTPFAHTAGAPDGVLRLAVARADTLRVVLTNTLDIAGSVSNLAVSRIPLAGTLTAPDGVSFAGASTGADNARFYVLKPGTAQPLAATLAVSGANHFMRSWPDGGTVLSVGSTARVLSPADGLLALIEVTRQSTGAAWNFTLSATHPPALPLSTDVAASTPPPDGLTLWRIDGLAGQQLSIGQSRAVNASINPVLRLFAPNLGSELLAPDWKGIYTLPVNGAYTLIASNPTTAGVPFTLRVNEVAEPEFASLGTLFERSGTLALGEVRRYSFNLDLAQMLALRAASSGTLDAGIAIEGGSIRNASLSLLSGGQPGKSVVSPALYVREAGLGTLVVVGTSRIDGRSSGPFSVQLQSPIAAPANLAQPIVASAQGGVLQTHAFDIGTAGKHLLCTSWGGGSANLATSVWGPSAPAGASWNLGDISTTAPGGAGSFVEDIGELRVGRNTLSLMTAAPGATATTQRLVALPAATDIAVGGSAGPLALAACERRYLRFAGTAGSSYTLRVTADFAGSVYVRKQPAVGGDWTARSATLGGTPLALTAGVERVVNFTIPASGSNGGNGTFVVEIDGAGEAAGTVTAILASP